MANCIHHNEPIIRFWSKQRRFPALRLCCAAAATKRTAVIRYELKGSPKFPSVLAEISIQNEQALVLQSRASGRPYK